MAIIPPDSPGEGEPFDVTVVGGSLSVTEPVSVDDNGGSLTVDGPLTDVELRATPVPVSGTVSVTEPVSVDDNGGSLTVDGPLTDAELRATPVPVSGTVSVTEPVSVDDNGGSLTVDGSVSVSNFPASQTINDGGGSITVDGSLTTADGRPSSGAGRTHVSAQVGTQTADVSVHTVTATKTLYIHTLVVVVRNGSAVNDGVLQIRDGAGGTVKMTISMSTSTGLRPAVDLSPDFQEPMQFTSGVYADVISGTLTFDVMLVGYEE
jgi:hypothetical protein